VLTRLRIRNFKRFNSIDVELGKNVVLIGPNNSGKTTALQALTLWDIGLRLWNEKRQGKSSPEKRPGVTINRKDLIALPIPNASLLWKDLHFRNMERVNGKPKTQNVRIGIIVDGISNDKMWSCGLEFDFANEESIYCRPLRLDEEEQLQRMSIPFEASSIHFAFLPPMSGLAAIEPKWESGRINVLLGEGQTAQVLRNLCYQIYERSEKNSDWKELTFHIQTLFGVTLFPPSYIKERGEITMSYREPKGTTLDISSSGRGLQQTLLLLAHLFANPKTILLLDEPDAHLEVLRQRQIYQLLTKIADTMGSQIIAASHSEIVLNEAADRDIVIAFVGTPHRIDDRGSQLMKALKDIGYEHYYQAEQTGWVLYLEGSTDLAILQTFAIKLNHQSAEILNEVPFVYYVGNQPQKAREHFFALKEAKSDFVGIALFDKLEKELQSNSTLIEMMWKKRELENYFCSEELLIAYARSTPKDDLFSQAESNRREKIMKESIEEITSALKTLRKLDPWSDNIKATDDFLDPLFEKYFEKLNLPNLLLKSDYYVLANLISVEKIDKEIIEKLDEIVKVAHSAKPTVEN
jgi:ABC-type thiamine transport system ATPase subunit